MDLIQPFYCSSQKQAHLRLQCGWFQPKGGHFWDLLAHGTTGTWDLFIELLLLPGQEFRTEIAYLGNYLDQELPPPAPASSSFLLPPCPPFPPPRPKSLLCQENKIKGREMPWTYCPSSQGSENLLRPSCLIGRKHFSLSSLSSFFFCLFILYTTHYRL